MVVAFALIHVVDINPIIALYRVKMKDAHAFTHTCRYKHTYRYEPMHRQKW